MGYRKISGYCARCGRQVVARCPVPAHMFHLLDHSREPDEQYANDGEKNDKTE
jgi:hypothetical protein